jgi:hypothetical protein
MMDRAVVVHHYQQHQQFRLKCQNKREEATGFSKTRNFSLKKQSIDSFFPT